MKCPFCSNSDTRVIDSRPVGDDAAIRRRRSCDVCGKRFTTYEKVETIPLIVIKKESSTTAERLKMACFRHVIKGRFQQTRYSVRWIT